MEIYGINGGVAQLARARGSYPRCRRFESYRRYQLSADSLNGKSVYNAEKNEIKSDVNSIIWPNFEEHYCLNNQYDNKIKLLESTIKQLEDKIEYLEELIIS